MTASSAEWIKSINRSLPEGPLASLIYADDAAFMYYESGIIYCDCIADPTDVTHEVVIIGYGLDSDGDSYWII